MKLKAIIFILLILPLFFLISCEKDFDKKESITIGVKTGDGVTTAGDGGFWTSEPNKSKYRHYQLNNYIDDIRITIVFGINRYHMYIGGLGSHVNLLYDNLEVVTVTDYRMQTDSTYSWIKSEYSPNVTYSDSAMYDTLHLKTPRIMNEGDILTRNMDYTMEVLLMEKVDTSADLISGVGMVHADLDISDWVPQTNKYIGLKYSNLDKEYLGWIKISTLDMHQVRLIETHIERVE